MVAVVIVGILASIAIPTYSQYVLRSRRTDATATLGTLQQAQERYRANQRSYASSLSTLSFSDVSPQGHYSIAIASASATGYTLTATVRSSSPQAKDTDCARMQLQMTAGNAIYTAVKSDLATPNTECWPK